MFMKKKILIPIVTTLILTSDVFARIGSPSAKVNPSTVAYKDEAGDCRIPVSQAELNINNVRCRLLAAGDLWWDFDKARYEVPKGDGTSVGIHAIFAGAIWLSAKDAAGNLKMAAQRFRQGNSDFYSGPLDNAGNIDLATCNLWDRHFTVLGSDIALIQAKFQQGNLGAADIPQSILLWPGKGNPALSSRGFNMNQNLAPFHDEDKDGIYNSLNGDYPIIKDCSQSYADQMTFWVFNDKGNAHTETSSQPMGIQVNALGFAFQTTDEINNMTFYTYNIINKSGSSLSETYISQFVDADLGCYTDDRIGCDTTRSLGVFYNSDGVDQDGCSTGSLGYGTDVPMLGLDFFEGPIDTNGKELGLTRFNYFNNGNCPQCDPSSAIQYRNYQEGFWKDGSIISFGGNGYGGSIPTKFTYPGDPSVSGQWSECNPQTGAAIPGDDRRGLLTSGPFTFLPNGSQTITIGVVFVRPQGGVGICPSFNNTIGIADDKAQALFNSCFKLVDGPAAPTLKIRELDKELIINLVNERSSNNYAEKYDEVDQTIITQTGFIRNVSDSTYTFQGYKVYQIVDDKVSSTDLDNPTKAVLIAQYDIRDGVRRLINYEKDPILNLLVPKLKTEGSDNGIEHTLRITKDFIKNADLVNHKTYYYTAIAYASNNFKEYDPGNPSAGGQLTQFLQGRGNFARYSAIPHKSDPRNEGTTLNTEWGDAVQVIRTGGQGNGGNFVNVTNATIDNIMSGQPFAKDTLVYERGFDPLGFKVTDPLQLKEADFELKLIDTTLRADRPTFRHDSAYWRLTDLTNGRVIFSERNMNTPYQQLVSSTTPSEEYGFALSVGTPNPVYVNRLNNQNVYRPISGSITFENTDERWLSFIKDAGSASVTNWIRSGKTRIGGADPLANVFDANFENFGGLDVFHDPDQVFDKIAEGTWAPYCLAANYAFVGQPGPETPPAVYGPAFKWDRFNGQRSPQNNLDRLQSVRIVLTPDKSKWSRCVVFETGEQQGTNRGGDISRNGLNARKGQIRMAFSKDKDGNTVIDPITGLEDTGRSWFPGYAINIETGQRLNVAFGEASEWGGQNGRDMLWNPTDQDFDDLDQGGTIPRLPWFGGKHFIYVMETPYDEGKAMQDTLLKYYTRVSTNPSIPYPQAYPDLYRQIMYTSIPFLTKGFKLKSLADGLIPSEVTIDIRVEKPFQPFFTNSALDTPTYFFSTKGLGTTQQDNELAKTALDLIRIVPNPYLAYSSYERNAADTRVKITNLPNNCTINIYSLDGTLIRTVRRSVGINEIDPTTQARIEIADGVNIDRGNPVNLDNSAEWDLKNEKNVPVASGVYLFEIDAPGIGHKILKWFGAMRPADVSNF